MQERKDVVKFIFGSMDVDGDGFLNASEMRRFAELCGFDDEWQVEYEAQLFSDFPSPCLLFVCPWRFSLLVVLNRSCAST